VVLKTRNPKNCLPTPLRWQTDMKYRPKVSFRQGKSKNFVKIAQIKRRSQGCGVNIDFL
jgi:hypothetical protein